MFLKIYTFIIIIILICIVISIKDTNNYLIAKTCIENKGSWVKIAWNNPDYECRK